MTYLGNSPGLTNFTVAVEKFTGTGACTEFQLAQNIADANAIDVRVSSVPQDPTTAYTLAAGLITFTEAPPNAANNIVVTYRNTAVITYQNIQTSQINDGAITASKLASGVGGDPAAGSYANSAFATANTVTAAGSYANSAFTVANGAFTAANSRVNAANTTSFSANVTFSYPVFLSNTVTIQQTLETTNVSATAAAGTVNFDILVSPVLYTTSNTTGNFTVNFRANSAIALNSVMSNNQSLSLALVTTQGATAYYNSAYQIDGSSVTPKWQGGTAPTAGNASGIDVYGYTIIKTANATFTVLASQTQFK